MLYMLYDLKMMIPNRALRKQQSLSMVRLVKVVLCVYIVQGWGCEDWSGQTPELQLTVIT